MKRLLIAAVALTPLAFAVSAQAGSLFRGGNKLDPSFCKSHNIRQTVVYIDDSILVNGNTQWTVTIYNKLKATFMPGERTTLIELSPSTGQSTEIWSGFWPAYTPEQTAKLAHQSHISSTGPLAALRDQQGFFFRDFGIAAEKIEQKGGKQASAAIIDPSKPPQKSIIRALASNGARYSHTQETIWAILCSDLAENSDLGSVLKPLPDPPMDYGAKLGTYLRCSVFYVFGAGSSIKGDGSIQDAIRAFWGATFRSMAANIGGLGTDLNVPNVVPVAAHNYDLLLKDGSQTLVGRLSLLTDSDGMLVDSWLGIVRLRNASLNETYHCTGPAEAPSCILQANTSGGVVTTSPSETVSLSSHDSSTLIGTIGVQGSNVNLPLAATPASD